MAKKHLEQYDKNGNRLDIYLNKDEVMVGNETLADKLDEMDAAIEEAAAQGGIQEETDPTVPSWAKQPTKPTYTAQEVGALPANTDIPSKTSDLENDSGFVTSTTMTTELAGKQDTLTFDNAPTASSNNPVKSGGIKTYVDGKATITGITTSQDGTFTITLSDGNSYTVNLNHTHENMAKIVKCTEATLPQTLENDTIYVQVDNANTPNEIESLWLFGLEFTGGGLPAGTPAITKPSGTSINLGTNDGSGVSKTIEIKANSHITGDLTVGLAANSNLSFDTTNLPSGVTYNSGAGTLTIAQATAMQGVNVTIVYSGSGAAEIDGGLVISGGGATPKSVVVVVVVVEVQPIAVKFTGSQWVNTGVSIGPSTSMKLDIEFLNAFGNSNATPTFLSTSNSGFAFNVGYDSASGIATYTIVHFWVQGADNQHDFGNAIYSRGVVNYSPQSLSFLGWTTTVATKTTTSENLAIGYGWDKTNPIFNHHNFKVYGLEIYENGVLTHHFVPKKVNGVTGLYDTETGNFITSETSTELEAVYEQSNS